MRTTFLGVELNMLPKPTVLLSELYVVSFFYRAFQALLMVCLLSIPQIAQSEDLSNLTGYLILNKERIEEFDGCEYGKIIQFESKEAVTCMTFGFQYAYYVDVAILVRRVQLKSGYLVQCKMSVEEKLYDVNCTDYIERYAKLLRRTARAGSRESRVYASKVLRFLDYD